MALPVQKMQDAHTAQIIADESSLSDIPEELLLYIVSNIKSGDSSRDTATPTRL